MHRQKVFSTTSRNRLSDRDMLLDLLMIEKHLSSLYGHGVVEANSPTLSNMFEQLQADTYDNARTLFDAIEQRGWYNPGQTERSGRAQKRDYKLTSDNFHLAATSKYAVTTGARNIGRRLAHRPRLGKSGIFNSQGRQANYQEQH